MKSRLWKLSEDCRESLETDFLGKRRLKYTMRDMLCKVFLHLKLVQLISAGLMGSSSHSHQCICCHLWIPNCSRANG